MTRLSCRHRRLATIVAALCAVGATSARADCAPVIAAYAKAQATGRYALYSAAGVDAPPKGEPFQVTVGQSGYVSMGKSYRAIGAGAAGAQAESLKEREKKGTARCEPAGERKVGDEAAVGYRIRDAATASLGDAAAIQIWIGRASGLPLYHAMGPANAGLHWVYGAAVTAPAADRISR